MLSLLHNFSVDFVEVIKSDMFAPGIEFLRDISLENGIDHKAHSNVTNVTTLTCHKKHITEQIITQAISWM